MEPAVVLESCSYHKISFLPFSTNLSFGRGKSNRVLDLGSMVGAQQIHASIGQKCPQRLNKKGRTIMVEKLISSASLLWSFSPHRDMTDQFVLCFFCSQKDVLNIQHT